MLLSNNHSRERVESFAEAVGATKWMYHAGKPLSGGFKDGMLALGTDPSSTIFVGDQVYTDMLGGKIAGLYTILTKPLDPSGEGLGIRMKRVLEKPVRARLNNEQEAFSMKAEEISEISRILIRHRDHMDPSHHYTLVTPAAEAQKDYLFKFTRASRSIRFCMDKIEVREKIGNSSSVIPTEWQVPFEELVSVRFDAGNQKPVILVLEDKSGKFHIRNVRFKDLDETLIVSVLSEIIVSLKGYGTNEEAYKEDICKELWEKRPEGWCDAVIELVQSCQLTECDQYAGDACLIKACEIAETSRIKKPSGQNEVEDLLRRAIRFGNGEAETKISEFRFLWNEISEGMSSNSEQVEKNQRRKPAEHRPSVLDVDFEELYGRGYRGILTDVDNTVAKQFRSAAPEICEKVRELKQMGFKICILSNNKSESHIRKIAHQIGGVPFVMGAKKPDKEGFQRALDILGTKPEETMMIGDQVKADVKGGNAYGLYTIQVDPLCPFEFLPFREVPVRIRYILSSHGNDCHSR